MANASDQPVAYEPSDADPRLIASLGGGIALFLVLSPLILALALPGSLHRLATEAYPPTPEPRLQISPREDLASFRSEEDKRLSTYGWADAKQKIIHMPIERAKELIIQRGLPGWSRS
jgi:hypothetical protein